MFVEILASLFDASSDAIDTTVDFQDSELEINANTIDTSELEVFTNEEDDKSYLIPPYDHYENVPDWVLGTVTVGSIGGGLYLWWRERNQSKT